MPPFGTIISENPEQNRLEQGVEDFEGLSAQEWTSLVEIFIARSIEFRVFNDIKNDALGGTLNVEQVDAIQADPTI